VSYYSSWSAYFKLWLFCPLINFLFGNINLFLYVIIMSFLIFYLLVCISRLFILLSFCFFFFFSSRRRHTRFSRDWSSDVCSSDLWGASLTEVGFVVQHVVSVNLKTTDSRVRFQPQSSLFVLCTDRPVGPVELHPTLNERADVVGVFGAWNLLHVETRPVVNHGVTATIQIG